MQLLLKVLVLYFICKSSCFFVSATECKTISSPLNVAYTITVSQSGTRNFTTIMDAINSIPSMNDLWIKIFINPGTYKEQIKILKSCILLEGHGISTTIISHDAHEDPAQSITFDVYADNFVAKGITFRNSYNRPIQPNQIVKPAVALRSFGDKHAYHSCGFEGYQDTLWDASGRHYFKSCYIEGVVDFIWGNAQSVYEGCKIDISGAGHIVAQGRESPINTSGFVFRKCKITGNGQGSLGRAYQAYSRVIIIDSFLDKCVDPKGWSIWNQVGHEKDVIFVEVDNKGPGADSSKRVPWVKTLSSFQLKQYSTKHFINQEGWIPKF